MGQNEVIDILKTKCLSGDNNFYSVAHIRKICLDKQSPTASIENVSRSVCTLNRWGILEKRSFDGVAKYRYRKSLLNDSGF